MSSPVTISKTKHGRGKKIGESEMYGTVRSLVTKAQNIPTLQKEIFCNRILASVFLKTHVYQLCTVIVRLL